MNHVMLMQTILSYTFSFGPGNSLCQDAAVSAMKACSADIKKWTPQNSLMLNDDKTEFIVHWLPMTYRIRFKIALFAYNAVSGLAPPYITDLISIETGAN